MDKTKRLKQLVGRYLLLEEAKTKKVRKPSPAQRSYYETVEEAEKANAEKYKIQNWNAFIACKHNQRERLKNYCRAKIIDIVPPHRWIVLTIGVDLYAVGVSTSDWGGGTSHFHMERIKTKQDAANLYKLIHRIT